jgi:hypothetical protein
MAKSNRARIHADKSLNGSAAAFASKGWKSLTVFVVLERSYD